MKRTRRPSSPTVRVVGALIAEPLQWRYGYELGAEVGLKVGLALPDPRPAVRPRAARGHVGDRSAAGPAAAAPLPPDGARARVCERARECACRNTCAPRDTAVERCPIGGLFILALVVLVAVRSVPLVRNATRSMRTEAGTGRAARALALAVRGLPSERAEWGDAMCAELAGVRGGRARWSFTVGCARTAVGMQMRAAVLAHDQWRDRPARLGAGCNRGERRARCLWPGALSGPPYGVGSWFAFLAFLAIMLAYGVAALSLSARQGSGLRNRAAVRRRRRPCGRRRLAA